MTYLERVEAALQPNFRQRIAVAALVAAYAVAQEDNETPNHAARARLAADLVREPEKFAALYALPLAAVMPDPANCDDDTVLAFVMANLDFATKVAGYL